MQQAEATRASKVALKGYAHWQRLYLVLMKSYRVFINDFGGIDVLDCYGSPSRIGAKFLRENKELLK